VSIFAQLAPNYWRASLPAIPLKRRSKEPAISRWSEYCHRMPEPSEQEAWLDRYRDGNIGLALGPASGLGMVDIDDEEYESAIRSVLPDPVWERKGLKGCQLAYRAPTDLESFKLKGARGMAVEMLYTGNQAVLPGSVHPDCPACRQKNVAGPEGVCVACGEPSLVYTSNCNLWEVV
jgi:putative DNA primase/helicase